MSIRFCRDDVFFVTPTVGVVREFGKWVVGFSWGWWAIMIEWKSKEGGK